MSQHDDDAIAAFIRASGVTRCPTACAAPTQAVVAAADRLALRQLAERRDAASETIREARARHPSGAPSLGWNIWDKELHKTSPLRRCLHACAEINRPFPGFDA